MDPPQNYSVVPPDAPDHEPAHNARVSEPYKALVPKLDPTVPANVRPHSRDVLTDIEDRPFFDYNGWQTFVGLIWPADPNMRGVPDATVTAENFAKFNTGEGETTPVVFETLLSSDTLFPSAADAASIPEQPPEWFSTTYSRPFDLTATSKAGALDEAFSNPLIDQNQQYVRYSVQVNRVFYEFIRQNGYYWKGNLPKSPSPVGIPPLDVSMAASDPKTEMPVVPLTQILQPQTNTTVIQPVNGNSITLKTAWRIMIEDDDPDRPWRKRDDLSRYYTAMAHVQNAVTGEREEKLVGLVGMHVVVRTTQFPQGLWSTFGHVDNLVTPPGGRASFKSDDSFYPSGFSYAPDASVFYPETARTPVEVSRIWKIPETPVAAPSNLPHGASTVGLNQSYKELFAGTVWQYYQLEVTQWPTDPGVFYASPFLYPRGLGERPDPSQPPAVHQAYERARANAAAAYPRWSGLPIPQVGALNPVMETYFQNPPYAQPLENTSCMGCHYGASDLGYVWVFKLGAWPPPYNQGRVNPEDSVKAAMPANTE
ncbi:MAG: hypothetical protein QNJ44_25035 [Rhodobacter sp.]|nr:hypothetical protein [Rhodobacter sp.]